MTVRRVTDWSYREARRRLVRDGRHRLAAHIGTPTVHDDGSRVVRCGCGWFGNGLGWASHLDSVVRSALHAEPMSGDR